MPRLERGDDTDERRMKEINTEIVRTHLKRNTENSRQKN